MSDFKKQWTNIPKRKKKKPYNSKKDPLKKRESKEVSPVFKNNNDFPSLPLKNELNTHSSNAFSALVWRKPTVSQITPIVSTNTIYEKAKKGFINFNSYPVLSTSPTFPMFQ